MGNKTARGVRGMQKAEKPFTTLFCTKTEQDESQYVVSKSEDGITLRCAGCGKVHSYEIGFFAELFNTK